MTTSQTSPQWQAPTPPTPPAIHSATVARVIGLVRGLTGVAGVVSFAVLGAEGVLPDAYKPSTLIGSFHGRVEAADAKAKLGPVTALTRKTAERAAQPPAFAAMETEAFRQQQQVLADSLQTDNAIANTADAACMVGKVIPTGDRDWGWLGTALLQACDISPTVRKGMMNTLRHGGQDNSVLIQRPHAGESGAE